MVSFAEEIYSVVFACGVTVSVLVSPVIAPDSIWWIILKWLVLETGSTYIFAPWLLNCTLTFCEDAPETKMPESSTNALWVLVAVSGMSMVKVVLVAVPPLTDPPNPKI